MYSGCENPNRSGGVPPITPLISTVYILLTYIWGSDYTSNFY